LSEYISERHALLNLHVKWCPFLSHAGIHTGGTEEHLHLILTAALDGVEWLISRLPPLYPQRNIPEFPLQKRMGGPQGQSGPLWEREKALASTGNRKRIPRPPSM